MKKAAAAGILAALALWCAGACFAAGPEDGALWGKDTSLASEPEDEDDDNTSTIIGGALLLAVSLAGLVYFVNKAKKDAGGSGGNRQGGNQQGGSQQWGNQQGGAQQGAPDVRGAGFVPNDGYDPEGKTQILNSHGLALMGVGGIMNGCRFPLNEGVVTFGRKAELCSVVFPNGTPGVSGVHCQVALGNGGCTIMDMGSKYGTFLNGARLQPNMTAILTPGSSFYLGSPENTFVLKEG